MFFMNVICKKIERMKQEKEKLLKKYKKRQRIENFIIVTFTFFVIYVDSRLYAFA